MGIEDAFRYTPPETIFINRGVDVSDYELKIARLTGEVRGWKENYNELVAIARQNKDLATQNALRCNMYKNTLKELVEQGLLNRESVNAMIDAYKEQLPTEDQELLAKKLI